MPIMHQSREKAWLRLQSAALAASTNTILITDADGCITWANPAFTCLTGYTLEEMAGRTPRMLKSGRQDETFYRQLWQTILGGEVWQGELADPAKVRRYVELILAGARDATGVVRRLREFYRPRDDNDELESVTLPELVAQVVALTQPKWKDQAQAEGRTIQVMTDFPPVPPVAGDEAALREMMTNLLFNAVDAMPRGGTITVRLRHAGQQVLLEVEDTGIGMTEEARQRCLEPFFSTKGEQGTGLGLAVVHGVVRRHHGEIAISSVPGNGTTVSLRLPASSPVQHVVGAVPAHEPAVAPLHVLHVDDEPAVRQVVAGYLRAEGHAVETAGSRRDALDWLRAGCFDVVITDSAMPGLSGRQLAVLSKELAPATPVILLTGFGDLMVASGEHPLGVDRVIGKPATRDTLREALAAVAGR